MRRKSGHDKLDQAEGPPFTSTSRVTSALALIYVAATTARRTAGNVAAVGAA